MHVGRLNPLKERIQCTLKDPDAVNISENETHQVFVERTELHDFAGELVEFGWRRSWANIFSEVQKGDVSRRGRVATSVER